MQIIFNNQELLDRFRDINSLLDGKIEKIEIFSRDFSVCINIHFCMRPSSDYQKIEFRFIDCKQYSFSYSENYYFYNVELVKFFECEDGLFYISFDPFDEVEVISEKDQDFILYREASACCEPRRKSKGTRLVGQ